MKGVIFSTSFFILIFVVFFNLSHYIHFEHNRTMINNNFKKGLLESAETIKDENVTMDNVLELIKDNTAAVLPRDYDYEYRLLGFYDDPLLLRVQIDCKSKVSNYDFVLEETIIESELNLDEEDKQ